MTSTTTTPTKKTLYVLYGSQMGNSEGAAKDFCTQFETRQKQQQQQDSSNVMITAKAIQLDDFLEVYHCPFSKNDTLPIIIIFVSSYGVGQAPLGSYRFREICETFIERCTTTTTTKEEEEKEDTNTTTNINNILNGISYAICGLGDSTYPTYFKNPQTIDHGLTVAGAKRFYTIGKADANASLSGDLAQDKVIENWIQNLWIPLEKQIQNVQKEKKEEETSTKIDYVAMQRRMIHLVMELDPDYTPPKDYIENNKNNSSLSTTNVIAAALVGGIAITALSMLFLVPK